MKEVNEKEMELRIRLAAQVEFWMLRFNMDLKAVVEASGLSTRMVYRIKKCEVNATLDTVAGLAKGFEIQPEVLLMPLAKEIDKLKDDRAALVLAARKCIILIDIQVAKGECNETYAAIRNTLNHELHDLGIGI